MLFRSLAASWAIYAANSKFEVMLQSHHLRFCKLSNTDLRPLLLAAKRSKAFLHASPSPLPPSGKAAGLDHDKCLQGARL